MSDGSDGAQRLVQLKPQRPRPVADRSWPGVAGQVLRRWRSPTLEVGACAAVRSAISRFGLLRLGTLRSVMSPLDLGLQSGNRDARRSERARDARLLRSADPPTGATEHEQGKAREQGEEDAYRVPQSLATIAGLADAPMLNRGDLRNSPRADVVCPLLFHEASSNSRDAPLVR